MKNLKKIPFILSILSLLTFFAPVNAEVKVVTSIKPIHSLASYLMQGVGKPGLIVVNPPMLVCGVNSESLLTVPTTVLLT